MKYKSTVVLFSVVISLAVNACDSEKEIERTHEDHEVFGARKTKPDSVLPNPALVDSILHRDSTVTPK